MGIHMNTQSHAHFLTRLRTVVVLSAMITTHSATAMPIPDQQVNPPLAQAQDVIKRANEFLDIKEKPRNKRLDEAQVQLYTMLTSGGVAVLSGALWLAQCAGQYGCSAESNILFVVAPAAVGLFSYLCFREGTTLSCYRNAVLQVSPIIKTLQNDDFFNGSITDQELNAYVIVRFGMNQGALRAIENYRNLHAQLQQVDILLEEVASTQDADLAQKCQDLQNVINNMSTQLIKKISILSQHLKEDVKDQLKQQREDAEKARLAVEKENGRLKQEQEKLARELQQERDRAAAIQAGNISYQRTVGQK